MISDSKYVPSDDQIDAVLEFLPIFSQEGFVPSTYIAPPGVFPYNEFAEDVSRFHQVVHDAGFVFAFDWVSWQDEAYKYVEHPERLEKADLQTIRQLITLHIRKERFCDGHLPSMISCGHITAVLNRLKEIRIAPEGDTTREQA